MQGKNHLVTSTGTVLLIDSGFYLLRQFTAADVSWIHNICGLYENIKNWFLDSGILPMVLFVPICVILFYLGVLFPDVDNEKSMLGRYVHIPLEHRTWTHAVWIPVVFFLISLRYRMWFWFSFGYFLHLLQDSLSVMGVCFLYPVSKYRKYPSGAKVKKNHRFHLYKNHQPSEYIVSGVMAGFGGVAFLVHLILMLRPSVLFGYVG